MVLYIDIFILRNLDIVEECRDGCTDSCNSIFIKSKRNNTLIESNILLFCNIFYVNKIIIFVSVQYKTIIIYFSERRSTTVPTSPIIYGVWRPVQ
jgi:hypothetical protein